MQQRELSYLQSWEEDYGWSFQSSASSYHPDEIQLLLHSCPQPQPFPISYHQEIQKILHQFHHQDLIPYDRLEQSPSDQKNKNQISKTVAPVIHNQNKRRSKPIKSNSPFHNYQKHLITALRRIVVVPKNEALDDYHEAAIQLWDNFKFNKIKNKKILQFVFNQSSGNLNENIHELKRFGLHPIYMKYDLEVINKAKIYLSHLVVKELRQDKIKEYLKTSKIGNNESFIDYIMNFSRQLQKGYVMRRIQTDKKQNN